ncbi:MAG: MFS transporter [Desulfovibrionales bacterium]|nr:MFS transporter [Desulfovibrionales bacterium]
MLATLRDKQIFGWAMYDFANSAFATTILAVIFNKYFALEVAGGERGVFVAGLHIHGATLFAVIVSLSMAVSALTAPILGAIADFSQRKKAFLAGFCYTGIIFTALLYLVHPGDVRSGAFFFIMANIGFSGGNAFYNAFLPQMTTPANVGRVSGLGWAFGYIGGAALLVLNLFMLNGLYIPGAGRITFTVQACFLSVAIWWALFSLPTFLWVREKKTDRKRVKVGDTPGRDRSYAAIGLARVKRTLSRIKKFRALSLFLIAFLFYNDGIETIVVMTSVFAAEVVGMQTREIIFLFLFIQAVAFIGSIFFGYVSDRLGHKRTILCTLFIWVIAVIWAFFLGWLLEARQEFWIICFLAGLVLGGSQAASRALQCLLTPVSHAAEFFGFFAISGRFASIFGPLSYGLLIYLTGSLRWGILSVAVFFIIGAIILLQVDEKAGMAEKAGYEEQLSSNMGITS